MCFQIKSLEFQAQAASAGSIQSFSLNEDGTAIISGETPVPDNNCVFPIIFGDMGVVEGFPVGTCAQVADGQWQMSLPADPGGNGVELDIDTSYQVILFCEDLTLPPSQPFAIHISPPPRN